ncbi:MAG TPA: hypothetical protein VIL46_10060, partial [Gemmataceae bacterium]
MFRRMVLSLLGLVSPAVAATAGEEPAPLRVATFQVDATPPLGSPLCGGGVKPAAEVIDLLSARGVVLLTDQSPIVLCAIDWVGIGNGGHDAFRAALAEAAGTTPDRVTVHTLHQHDAPACDFTAEELLDAEGLGGVMFDPKFARLVIARTARAVKQSLGKARPVTHVGLGVGVVEKVASNRRILGPDGRVAIVRYSSSRNPAAVAAPEGVIDPKLRLVSLWDGDRPLVSITHYATHPQ